MVGTKVRYELSKEPLTNSRVYLKLVSSQDNCALTEADEGW